MIPFVKLPDFPRRRRAFTLTGAAGFLALTGALGALVATGAARPREDTPSASAPVAATNAGAAAPLTWKDLAGKSYGPDDIARAKATVFFFVASECPVAGQYTPRFIELGRDYQAKNVRFFVVNSNVLDSRAVTAKWATDRKFPFPAVKDNGTALADRLGATATPEAVVLDASGVIRYIGRIDDSVDRAKVSRRDVRDALDAVLADRPVKNPRTRAFGCQIFRDTLKIAAASAGAAKVTFARDVAPILNQNCVSCHRTGDVAPFALDNYAQAKVWSSAIKDYTTRRLMPPWKAVGNTHEFADARYLSDKQVATLARWADSGAPFGDKKDLPPAPKMYAPGDWPLGKPDQIIKPARAYQLEAEGKDVYRDFALPVDFNEDRYISAFDFKPGNRAIVHHIIAYIDLDGSTVAARDGKEDAQPGWSVTGAGSGIRKSDWGSGWAPGMNPRRFPAGVAVKVPQGAKMVLQVHYHKTGKPEVDRSAVALYFAKGPVESVVKVAPVGNPFFSLKPNVADQQVKADFITPIPVTLYGVLPHMHMLGKEMTVTATLPDGTKRPLIQIKNWEFNWQMGYQYKQPVKLPAGTRVSMVATFDNTTQNRNQPSNPPKTVKFGEQTTDEMCFAFLSFTMDGVKEAQTDKAAGSIPTVKGASL